MIQRTERGTQKADNIIDNILSFDVSSTWSVIGTGTASITTSDYFQGSGALLMNNTNYLLTDLEATNTKQSTVIPFDGIYDFSLYLKKSLAEDVTLDVEIFKNGALMFNNEFIFSADFVDNWTSYITNQNFNLLKGDVITFRFKINSNALSSTNDITILLDGLHFYNKERYQINAPIYSQSIYKKADTKTGWGYYKDDVYTEASPFTITQGTTATIPNNKAVVLEDQKAIGVTTYYDGAKLRPAKSGDYNIITLEFKAKNTVANGYGETSIDIGGTFGQIFPNVFQFPRGANVEHSFRIPIPGYSADTFLANGGLPKLSAGNGNISIYDIGLQFATVHSAK